MKIQLVPSSSHEQHDDQPSSQSEQKFILPQNVALGTCKLLQRMFDDVSADDENDQEEDDLVVPLEVDCDPEALPLIIEYCKHQYETNNNSTASTLLSFPLQPLESLVTIGRFDPGAPYGSDSDKTFTTPRENIPEIERVICGAVFSSDSFDFHFLNKIVPSRRKMKANECPSNHHHFPDFALLFKVLEGAFYLDNESLFNLCCARVALTLIQYHDNPESIRAIFGIKNDYSDEEVERRSKIREMIYGYFDKIRDAASVCKNGTFASQSQKLNEALRRIKGGDLTLEEISPVVPSAMAKIPYLKRIFLFAAVTPEVLFVLAFQICKVFEETMLFKQYNVFGEAVGNLRYREATTPLCRDRALAHKQHFQQRTFLPVPPRLNPNNRNNNWEFWRVPLEAFNVGVSRDKNNNNILRRYNSDNDANQQQQQQQQVNASTSPIPSPQLLGDRVFKDQLADLLQHQNTDGYCCNAFPSWCIDHYLAVASFANNRAVSRALGNREALLALSDVIIRVQKDSSSDGATNDDDDIRYRLFQPCTFRASEHVFLAAIENGIHELLYVYHLAGYPFDSYTLAPGVVRLCKRLLESCDRDHPLPRDKISRFVEYADQRMKEATHGFYNVKDEKKESQKQKDDEKAEETDEFATQIRTLRKCQDSLFFELCSVSDDLTPFEERLESSTVDTNGFTLYRDQIIKQLVQSSNSIGSPFADDDAARTALEKKLQEETEKYNNKKQHRLEAMKLLISVCINENTDEKDKLYYLNSLITQNTFREMLNFSTYTSITNYMTPLHVAVCLHLQEFCELIINTNPISLFLPDYSSRRQTPLAFYIRQRQFVDAGQTSFSASRFPFRWHAHSGPISRKSRPISVPFLKSLILDVIPSVRAKLELKDNNNSNGGDDDFDLENNNNNSNILMRLSSYFTAPTDFTGADYSSCEFVYDDDDDDDGDGDVTEKKRNNNNSSSHHSEGDDDPRKNLQLSMGDILCLFATESRPVDLVVEFMVEVVRQKEYDLLNFLLQQQQEVETSNEKEGFGKSYLSPELNAEVFNRCSSGDLSMLYRAAFDGDVFLLKLLLGHVDRFNEAALKSKAEKKQSGSEKSNSSASPRSIRFCYKIALYCAIKGNHPKAVEFLFDEYEKEEKKKSGRRNSNEQDGSDNLSSLFGHRLLANDDDIFNELDKLTPILNQYSATSIDDSSSTPAALLRRDAVASSIRTRANRATLLHVAIADANLELDPIVGVPYKLDEHEKSRLKNNHSNNAATTTCQSSPLEIVRYLVLKKGADIWKTDYRGRNALQLAASRDSSGSIEIFQFLYERAKKYYNSSPSRQKQQQQQRNARKLLSRSYRNDDDDNNDDDQQQHFTPPPLPIHEAVKNGHLAIAKLLLQERPELIDLRDDSSPFKELPIHHVKSIQMAKFLTKNLSAGKRRELLNAKTAIDKETVLHLVAQQAGAVNVLVEPLPRNVMELYSYLRDECGGANDQVVNAYGTTPSDLLSCILDKFCVNPTRLDAAKRKYDIYSKLEASSAERNTDDSDNGEVEKVDYDQAVDKLLEEARVAFLSQDSKIRGRVDNAFELVELDSDRCLRRITDAPKDEPLQAGGTSLMKLGKWMA